MPRYLNRKQKDLVLTLGGLIALLEDVVKDLQKEKDELKKAKKKETITLKQVEKLEEISKRLKEAKMATSFSQRLLDTYFEGLDDIEKEKLLTAISGRKIVVMPTLQAEREYRKMAEMDQFKHIEKDDFLDMCDHVLQNCMKYCNEKPEQCNIRKIMLKYNVEPLDPDAEGCPFKYS